MVNIGQFNTTEVIPGIIYPHFANVPFAEAVEPVMVGDSGTSHIAMAVIDNVSASPSVSQGWDTAISGTDMTLNRIQMATYNITSKYGYNKDESDKFTKATGGQSLDNVMSAITEAGVSSCVHFGALYGFGKGYNQGIIAGSTKASLPPDSTGATTVSTYSDIDLYKFIIETINDVRAQSFGGASPTILFGPRKFINYIQTALVSFLQSAESGGLNSVAGTINLASRLGGVEQIKYIEDDSLIGRGTDGKDLFFLLAPRIKEDQRFEQFNQNILIDENGSGKKNAIMAVTVPDWNQRNPVVDGFESSFRQMSLTAGLLIRPEAMVSVSYTF